MPGNFRAREQVQSNYRSEVRSERSQEYQTNQSVRVMRREQGGYLMATSAELINDLEDARADLKALERQDKRARKLVAAGIASLSVMAATIALTGNGIYAWAIMPAAAMFAVAGFDLFHTMRTVQVGNYSWQRSGTGRLDLARNKVRKLEREYSAAVMAEAGK